MGAAVTIGVKALYMKACFLQVCVMSCIWMLIVMCRTLKANVSLLLCVLQLLLLASGLHLATPHFT